MESYYRIYVNRNRTVSQWISLSLYVCTCVCPCCEVIQGFVRGIWERLCRVLSWPVNSHGSSQAMCSASFVREIIIGDIILPYYCHMLAKHCREARNEAAYRGWRAWVQVPVSLSLFFLTPWKAWVGWSGVWMEGEKEDGRRRGSREGGGAWQGLQD